MSRATLSRNLKDRWQQMIFDPKEHNVFILVHLHNYRCLVCIIDRLAVIRFYDRFSDVCVWVSNLQALLKLKMKSNL